MYLNDDMPMTDREFLRNLEYPVRKMTGENLARLHKMAGNHMLASEILKLNRGKMPCNPVVVKTLVDIAHERGKP